MNGAREPRPGDLLETRRVLVADWGIETVPGTGEEANWKLLLEALAHRVAWLLRHNPGKLVNAMYVLDISEARYEHAMGESTTEAKALALAQVILERESEKIVQRRKYASRQDGHPTGQYLEGTKEAE